MWRWLLGGAGGLLLVLVLTVLLGAKWALARYLESDRFRATIDHATGETLHAEVMFSPFHVSETTFSSAGVEAHGSDEAAFARLEMNGLSARWSMRRLLDRVCEIDAVEAEQVSVQLDGPRLPAALESAPPPAPSAWLPNRVEIRSFAAQRAEMRWAGGGLRDVAIEAASLHEEGTPDQWKIHGRGGTLHQGTWAPLALESMQLRYRAPTLFVQQVSLKEGATGSVTVEGEVQMGESVDLTARWDRLPVGSLLSPDWRMRVSGDLSGEAQVRATLPGSPSVTGHWSLAQGKLEALPVLDQLATFTGTSQFRRLALERAEGDFRWTPERLELTKIVAEAPGLARLEGGFTLAGEKIRGDLQVGIVPPLVHLVPGVTTGLALFGVTRGGYLWTTIHLDGPLAHPTEDLTARLAQAMAGHAVDAASQAAGQAAGAVQQGAKQAAKGVLDLFFGR